MTRRPHGTGSVFQEHGARYGCPPLNPTTRTRPEHDCHGPWVGAFEAGWTTKGTRARRRVKAPTEREARQRLLASMRQVQTTAPTVGARPTVHSWAATWLDTTRTSLRPSTWATNRSAISQWIDPAIGRKKLEDLTPGDVRAVANLPLAAGRLPSTATRVHVVLQWMLKDAIREGHRVPPAALLVDGPGVGESDRDTIDFDDAMAILKAAADLPDRSRWVAALLQGMRPAECLGLTWSAINWTKGQVDVSWQLKALPYNITHDRSSGFRVPTGYVARQVYGAVHLVRPKTTSGRRIIPLVPWMRTSLQEWRAVAPHSPAGLVWPRPDGMPRDPAADRAAWYALTDLAQVARLDDDQQGRRYVLYEARHTTATLLAEAGVPEATIVAIMGHASILSTRAYLHSSSSAKRSALDDVATRLGLTAS